MSEPESEHEKFVRWQGICIAQLSYSINLILTFTVAAIGFEVTLLLSKDFSPTSWQSCLFSISIISLLASGALGIWCTVNRLRDFRATAKIANLKRKNKEEDKIRVLQTLTNRLGKKTWGIFWFQVGAFAAGILLLVISVAFTVSGNLQ